jgi:hypothetical protein
LSWKASAGNGRSRQPIGPGPCPVLSLAYLVPWSLVRVSSQVKLLIINNAFCIVQRATAQSKKGFFCDYGVAEAPPGFQAGWSYCMYFFSLFLFILFADLNHKHYDRLN